MSSPGGAGAAVRLGHLSGGALGQALRRIAALASDLALLRAAATPAHDRMSKSIAPWH